MARRSSSDRRQPTGALLMTVAVLVLVVVLILVNTLDIFKPRLPDQGNVSSLKSGKATPPPAPAHPATDRERLIAAAYTYLGIPYKYGGKTTKALDCSGFTKLPYADIGVTIPDGSYNQAEGEKPLTSPDDLAPGDLIFYRFWPKKNVTHVTMYRGDGWIIGTGTAGQAHKVSLYPLKDDLSRANWTLTYRHIVLPDEQ